MPRLAYVGATGIRGVAVPPDRDDSDNAKRTGESLKPRPSRRHNVIETCLTGTRSLHP